MVIWKKSKISKKRFFNEKKRNPFDKKPFFHANKKKSVFVNFSCLQKKISKTKQKNIMDGLAQMVGDTLTSAATTVINTVGSYVVAPAVDFVGAVVGGDTNGSNNDRMIAERHRKNFNAEFKNGNDFFSAGVSGNDGVSKDASAEDIFATAAKMREEKAISQITGNGYNLSFVHHKHREAHDRPYFFASAIGAPFPSYHSNPMPNFPARWTDIEGANTPCENLTAPRIRLAPKELTNNNRDILAKMRATAEAEQNPPNQLESLNLAYQALGDPYQYEAFVTFMDLNRNVKVLNLNDNDLEDINDLNLTTVVRLHVSRNNFVSFEALPVLPNCEELFLSENFLSGFNGIDGKKFPKVRVLEVGLNPIAMLPNYREKLKKKIPSLEYVDGLRVL